MALFSKIKKEQVKFAANMKVLGRTTAGAGEGEEVAILNDNGMVGATATNIATSSSIKAYVDGLVGGADLDFQGDAGGALSIDLDSETLDIAGGNGITTTGSVNEMSVALDAALTTVDSIYKANLKIGEDVETRIDFDDEDKINFQVGNTKSLILEGGVLYPATDALLDLGKSDVEFKDAFFDGTVTSDAFAGPLTGNVTGSSSLSVVTDSSTDANYDMVFTDGSAALLEDNGVFHYNPSAGLLTVPNLSVAGTTTQVDTVTMNAANAIVFEGASANTEETTLSIVDPTADHTQYLINQSGYIPLLATITTVAITSTPAELNLLDTSAAGSIQNSKAVIYAADGQINATSLDVADEADIGTILTLSAGGGTNKALTFSSNSSISITNNHATALTIEASDNTAMMTFDTRNNQETIKTNKPLSVEGGLASLGLQDKNWGRYDNLLANHANQQDIVTPAVAGRYDNAVNGGTLKGGQGGAAAFECIFLPTGGNNSRFGALDLVTLNGMVQAVEYLDGAMDFLNENGLDIGDGTAAVDAVDEATLDSSKVELLKAGKIDCLIVKDSSGDGAVYCAFLASELNAGDSVRIIAAH